MKTIGLLGRMAAGKSTVASLFAEHGGAVIDADRLAHEVLDETAVRAEIVARFGAGVLAADGAVDRRRLAAIVFGAGPGPAAALADLEAIVHPRVHARIETALAVLRSRPAADGTAEVVAVLDVPLLVKAGWHAACDAIVRVECEEGVRRARLAARGIDPAAQAARDAAWEAQGPGRLPGGDSAAARPAEYRVDTSGDLAYTQSQVDRIWRSLTAGEAVGD